MEQFTTALSELSNLESEKIVLGTAMSYKSAQVLFVKHMKPEYFYTSAHRAIAVELLNQLKDGGSDPVTLFNALKSDKYVEAAGGMTYLMELVGMYVGDDVYLRHVNIVRGYYFRRRQYDIYIKGMTNVAKLSESPISVHESSLLELTALVNEMSSGQKHDIKNVLSEVEVDIEMAFKGEKPGGLMPIGYESVDEIIGGVAKKDLVILAARPGMGKTSFALSIAVQAIKRGQKVKFFSLEMSAAQLVTRIACSESGVNSQDLKGGRISTDQYKALKQAIAWIRERKDLLSIDDKGSTGIADMRASLMSDMMQAPSLIIVDYIQLMSTGSKGTRNDEVGELSRGLKTIASDLDIPVIALSQLSRKVEARPDKKPILPDLRESGNLEQDADMVWFIYRPEEYGMHSYDDGVSTEGVAEIIVAKQRNGPIGNARLIFVKSTTSFYEPAARGIMVKSKAFDDIEEETPLY